MRSFCWLLFALVGLKLGLAQDSVGQHPWSIGLQTGTLHVVGEVDKRLPGLSLGLFGQKAIRTSPFSMRFTVGLGRALGQDLDSSTNYLFNPALNQQRDSLLFYPAGTPVFHNFRMRMARANVLFLCKVSQLLPRPIPVDIYLTGGGGTMLSLTQINAINEAQGALYDYGSVLAFANPEDRKQALNQLMDDTYETLAAQDRSKRRRVGDAVFDAVFMGGLGLSYAWSTHWVTSLELTYFLLGTDLTDGQRWLANNQTSPDSDRLVSFSISLQYRLVRATP